jgi:hypothetical protein
MNHQALTHSSLYRHNRRSHILAIPDVVKAIVDFKDDPETPPAGRVRLKRFAVAK